MAAKRWWPDPSEALPVDVLPRSNGEYVPPPPTAGQRAVMRLADEETERLRRRMGMSRRQFVRTSAALAVGFWAVDALGDTRFGSYARGATPGPADACDLEWAGREGLETVRSLPGEAIFDVQSHHVDPDGLWRVTNPGMHAFFATVWPQSRDGGDVDPIANLSRFHYAKELFLDSATTAAVLSAVPTAPDRDQPLPIAEALETARLVNDLAGSRRVMVHAFVMPNRGAAGAGGPSSRYRGLGWGPHIQRPDARRNGGQGPAAINAEELDLMAERAAAHADVLAGWKVYCPWGDVPYASGWTLDSPEFGQPFLAQVVAVSRVTGVPPVVAAHKGFALPGFDQQAASPRDVGPAAADFPEVRFLVYHSGHDVDEGPQQPYAGDAAVPDGARSVDALIKSLRRSGLDGPANGGNSPNVWAELGSVWRDYMGDPASAAHLLGKLITHVGPKRVVWGTDSLWYGSPQPEIVALRRFDFTAEGKELYGLPHGLEGDVDDPSRPAPTPDRTIRNGILGRNAALAYGMDLDTRHAEITCDAVNALREGYVVQAGTERETRPLASLTAAGPRTRRALLGMLAGKPWGP